MSTGILSNPPIRMSFVPRHGLAAMGVAILSAGLFLGGCNGKLKDENQALRDQNAEFKEKLTSTEGEKAALATQLQQVQTEKDRMASEVAAARAQPQAYQAQGMQTRDNNGDGGWSGNSKSSGRNSRAADSERRIVIAGDTLFGSGSATLKPTAKKSLDALLPQVKSAHNVTVEGFTDSDPVTKSHWKSNTALSKARAEAVTTYLVSKGVSKSKISSVGKGASEPKGSKAESRRVEIVVAE